jgi:hypothetical protein
MEVIAELKYGQPELYCKSCGALIPDNNDRRDMGEGSWRPSLLACAFCATLAGGKLPPVKRRPAKLRELELKGQQRFDVPVLRIT